MSCLKQISENPIVVDLVGDSLTFGRCYRRELEGFKLVSRYHAQFHKLGNEWILEDLDSKNGVFVNFEQIKRKILKNGNIISFGKEGNEAFRCMYLKKYNSIGEEETNRNTSIPLINIDCQKEEMDMNTSIPIITLDSEEEDSITDNIKNEAIHESSGNSAARALTSLKTITCSMSCAIADPVTELHHVTIKQQLFYTQKTKRKKTRIIASSDSDSSDSEDFISFKRKKTRIIESDSDSEGEVLPKLLDLLTNHSEAQPSTDSDSDVDLSFKEQIIYPTTQTNQQTEKEKCNKTAKNPIFPVVRDNSRQNKLVKTFLESQTEKPKPVKKMKYTDVASKSKSKIKFKSLPRKKTVRFKDGLISGKSSNFSSNHPPRSILKNTLKLAEGSKAKEEKKKDKTSQLPTKKEQKSRVYF